MRKIILALIHFLFNNLLHTNVRGKENVPSSGSFVLASNHLGIVDALLVYHILDRDDLFIPVAEKWEKIPLFRFLAKHLDFIFIDRFNPDIKAMRAIMQRMAEGKVLVIAPEGTRSRTGALIEAKPGVSYLAARSGFPIVPAALFGTEDKNVFGSFKRLRRPEVFVVGGKPFKLPPFPKRNREDALQIYTDEIMCQIAALLPPAYWGVYADHPRLKELINNPDLSKNLSK
jgi:1-acyl-sn-glycerol-3-phosphate acyltransferase